jgi:hypothetical protein
MSYKSESQLWNDLIFIFRNQKVLNKRNWGIFFDGLCISSNDNYYYIISDASIKSHHTGIERYRDYELTVYIEKNFDLVNMWEGKEATPEFGIAGHHYGSKLTNGAVLSLLHKALCPIVRKCKLQELGI